MQIHWENLFLLGVLSATVHWIVARASITRFFWSRVRGWLAKLLACPACSGFWIGLTLMVVDVQVVEHASTPVNWVTNGLLGLYLTPVFQAVFLLGLDKSTISTVDVPVDN